MNARFLEPEKSISTLCHFEPKTKHLSGMTLRLETKHLGPVSLLGTKHLSLMTLRPWAKFEPILHI